MRSRTGILAVTAAISAASFMSSVASAQSFGVYVGSGYPAYDYGGPAYYGPGYDERREAWLAHERWEQRERWEQEEARRRYWEHERWEHRGDWHDDDPD